MCKHLVTHFTAHQDDIPEDLQPFRDLIISFGLENKAIPPMGEIADYGDIEGMAYFFTGHEDSLPWLNVYTEGTGTERYGYNVDEKRWARGLQPPYGEELEALIEKASW